MVEPWVVKLDEVGMGDVALVGGKNASLGEMLQRLSPKGVRVPGGFVVTAAAYRYFMKETGLEELIKTTLTGLDTYKVVDLAKRGKAIRTAIEGKAFPADLETAIVKAYRELEKEYGSEIDVAVRSSATAEDLPTASFAGQQESYLGVRGPEGVLKATRAAMASLFTDRAISYRVDQGFDHLKIALSVGVQKMARSDLGAAGVMFTLETESGFRGVTIINGSWGLGELVVKGEVTPDEFLVFKKTAKIIAKQLGVKNRKLVYSSGQNGKITKLEATSEKERKTFVLSDSEILSLANWGRLIEEHYSRKKGSWAPMDIEWAKDGKTGDLFIVQARPETVHSQRDFSRLKQYKLEKKGKVLTVGTSVGSKIAVGTARVILNVKDIGQFKKGEVLVTEMTDPDWQPIMKIAAAIVTDKGGRTSHAAIVSRELGIPAVVGTEEATKKIKTGDKITVDTTGNAGTIYLGELPFTVKEHDAGKVPETRTKIMMNIGMPEEAFANSFLPNAGVGLLRLEFIIASEIGIHPMALINYQGLKSQASNLGDLANIEDEIKRRTVGYEDKVQFYIDKLAFGIGKIAAAFYPKPVIVRLSDFKSNEYASLLGGKSFEPEEENPMLGWRGASRYYHENFAEAFKLEIKALKKVVEEMGLDNAVPMVPFCRTVEEGKKVLWLIRAGGLDKCSVYMMCEIPSNALLAEEFLDIFDGMSIGSNDLTQLVLGLDRDSEIVSGVGNEKNEAVKKMIAEVIRICKKRKKYVGICGQAPSDYPEFAEFLVEEGIESISLNPDTVIETTMAIAKKEKALKGV